MHFSFFFFKLQNIFFFFQNQPLSLPIMSMFLPVRERIDNLYKFNNPQLLLQSVTHMSWLNEQMGADLSLDNQRLEFLGDAALKAMQARILFEKYPTWDEGRLTKTRAGAENNRNLAVWCRYLGLDTAIKVGHGMSRDPSRAWDGICAQVGGVFNLIPMLELLCNICLVLIVHCVVCHFIICVGFRSVSGCYLAGLWV